MVKTLSGRRWLVAALCAVIGMVAGLLIAYVLLGHSKRYAAQATLAMLPASYIPTSEAAQYWDVLNHGQATRSAAIVFGQSTWLQSAAAAANVPPSELTMSAGAVRDTTLIEVSVEAGSPEAAEAALSSVLSDASGPATTVAGPFRLEVVRPPAGSAQALGPGGLQAYGAAGLAGLALGAGVGLLVGRRAGSRNPESSEYARHAAGSRYADTAEESTLHTEPMSPEPTSR
ncbi:hypothetical protein H7I77_23865 [Mycolicibacterium novocastrense]|uniref:Capsular polysaccharide biosynthesis protein n=1 Tax=Mycolicibacterium novocastrense TaxID=59813 RepID=A0AAW5SR16_MYCNV|nr:hypothetical protein [Mycolicibacterium novocastrense]MCV7026351.1 hypothetical protein [Mycolicibacterium novocastrense]GAT11188.1 uncharacterized protein RMCN_4321 [Mycolicibacterium novocastrense]